MEFLPSIEFVFALLGYLCIPLHFVGQRALGRAVISFLFKSAAGEGEESEGAALPRKGFAAEFLAGLLTYLVTLLFLKSVGCPWQFAVFLPYLITLHGDRARHYEGLFTFSSKFTLQHAIWISTHLILGLTLFDYLAGAISTPWKNAYGDQAYHFSMISSFALADNFPPSQVIFAGVPLSYPFFINLWSASLWFWDASFFFLSIIFIYQWMILWEVIYDALDGDEKPFLPWLLLLSGGTYYSLGENSGALIPQGFSFTSFLTTIWIPQRSSVFGVAVCCTVLKLYFRWNRDKDEHSSDLPLAGFLLGLAPLVNTHICLMTGLFVLGLLFLSLFTGDEPFEDKFKNLLRFVGFAALSLHALPFLIEKQSLLSIGYSGFFTQKTAALDGFYIIAFKNLWTLLLLFSLLWVVSGAHKVFLVLTALIAAAWCVRLSVWEWDQLKLFIPLYIVLLFVLGQQSKKLWLYLFGLVPILIVPTLYELAVIFQKGERFEVFSKKKIQSAMTIHRNLPKDAVLLAPPHHNTAAVLTGRTLYIGYNGWLWSHGIDYHKREKTMKDLDFVLQCVAGSCPDYLVWTDDAKRYWKKSGGPPAWLTDRLTPELYQIRKRNEGS